MWSSFFLLNNAFRVLSCLEVCFFFIIIRCFIRTLCPFQKLIFGSFRKEPDSLNYLKFAATFLITVRPRQTKTNSSTIHKQVTPFEIV